eukprot:UN07820
MLICGEDLGMIPDCVPPVMDDLSLLGLRLQRMPADNKLDFYHPDSYQYLTVNTTSSHDCSTLRGWWEEDRILTQKFYTEILGIHGEAPHTCEEWVAESILTQHFYSPSMWCIIPLQDYFALDRSLCVEDPTTEQINVPANSKHYWRFRLNINLEDLKNHPLCDRVRGMLKNSGR